MNNVGGGGQESRLERGRKHLWQTWFIQSAKSYISRAVLGAGHTKEPKTWLLSPQSGQNMRQAQLCCTYVLRWTWVQRQAPGPPGESGKTSERTWCMSHFLKDGKKLSKQRVAEDISSWGNYLWKSPEARESSLGSGKCSTCADTGGAVNRLSGQHRGTRAWQTSHTADHCSLGSDPQHLAQGLTHGKDEVTIGWINQCKQRT